MQVRAQRPSAGPEIRPGRTFTGPNVRLLGLCFVQHERPDAKWIYLPPGFGRDPEIVAGLEAGSARLFAVAVAVPGPDLGEKFPSLICNAILGNCPMALHTNCALDSVSLLAPSADTALAAEPVWH